MTEQEVSATEQRIKEIISGWTNDQRKDYYFLASIALHANDPEHDSCAKQIAAIFGNATSLTLYVIMSACYSALTPSEQDAD